MTNYVSEISPVPGYLLFVKETGLKMFKLLVYIINFIYFTEI